MNNSDRILIYGVPLDPDMTPPWLENQYNAKGSFIYLHGKLEDMNGFDICILPDYDYDEILEDGIYPALIKLYNGKEVTGTMFYWRDPYEVRKFDRGLIVLDGDDEAYDYAKSKYSEKSIMI